MSFLEMSFTGAVLILAILILRTVLINKLPKRTFLILWTVAVLRLLLPFSMTSSFSVYTLAEHSISVSENAAEILPGNIQMITDDIENMTEHTASGLAADEKDFSVWLIVWAAGAGILALLFFISYIRCYREFQTALPLTNENVTKWINRQLEQYSGRYLCGRPVSVRQSDRISTPLTYGVFHPVILMPKNAEWDNRQQLQYVLMHEYMHICHWDALWKLVCVFVVCVHWFNPMVWLLYFFCNRDMELVCDESVLRRLGEKCKADYARTLIDMEEKRSALVPVYSGFGRNAIQERIRAIMKIRKVSIGVSLFCAVLIGAVAVGFATSAGTKSRNEKADSAGFVDEQNNENEKIPEVQISEDAQEVKAILDNFSAAYFNGDEQGVKKHLSDPYEWDIELRDSKEEVSNVQVKGLENIQAAEIGDTCVASVEYLDSPQSDSYQYLSVELVKQSDGWKIYFYGIEK